MTPDDFDIQAVDQWNHLPEECQCYDGDFQECLEKFTRKHGQPTATVYQVGGKDQWAFPVRAQSQRKKK